MESGENRTITIEVDAETWRRIDLQCKDTGQSPRELAQSYVARCAANWEEVMRAAWNAYRLDGGIKDFERWIKFRRMLIGGRPNG